MIDVVDSDLTDWVQTVVPGAKVSLDAPGADESADVSIYLVALDHMPPARGDDLPPLQVGLHYLVTTGGTDVAQAHKRLGDLVFAAMQHEGFEVRFDRGVGFWGDAGLSPRPSFVLSMPLRQPVERPAPPPVRKPLVVQGGPVHRLTGFVVGPGEVPLADAFVEMPALTLTTRSDRRGLFRFDAVPSTPAEQQLRVRTKGREFTFSVDSSKPEPVTLRLDLLEE